METRIGSRFSRYKRTRKISLGSVFGLIVVVLLFSYKAGTEGSKIKVQSLQEELNKFKNNADQTQADNTNLKQKLTSLEHHYEIKEATEKNLTQHLKTLQAEYAELSKDMSLYQTLNGGGAIGQGLQIKTFQVYASENKNTFRYLLILSKQASPQKFAEGAVKMTIFGKIGEKPIQLPVKYVDSTRSDGLDFKFRHLQELTGELTLPEHFVAEEVLFQVYPDKDWPQLQQHYPWTAG